MDSVPHYGGRATLWCHVDVDCVTISVSRVKTRTDRTHLPLHSDMGKKRKKVRAKQGSNDLDNIENLDEVIAPNTAVAAYIFNFVNISQICFQVL